MKAATDVKLKELMRIVASGRATKEQLQEFQGYIDMLTAQSNSAPLGPPGQMRGPPPPAPPQMAPQGRPMPPHPQQPQQPMMMHHMQPPPQMYPPPPQQLPVQLQHRPPQPVQRPAPTPKKSFPQAPKQEICGIVFEFLDSYSQGDRFLFPRFSILEYLNNGKTVKASFLITRKPPGLEDEFFESVTITLECNYPRILEHLRMVVADPDTTRAHMKEIMSTKKRVNPVFLAYRLRRELGEPKAEPATVAATPTTPHPPPPKVKHVKKVRTSLASKENK
jgi:hypothetical protein